MRFPRLFLTLLILLSVSTFAFAANPFSFLRNGEYAFYHDTRGSADYYRGYCVFKTQDGSAVFFIRNLDLASGRETDIEATLGADKLGNPVITNLRLPEKNPPANISQSYVDLLTFLSIRNADEARIGYDTTIKDAAAGGTMLYHFNRDLPLFGLDAILKEGDSEAHYLLDRVGIIGTGSVREFFRIAPLAKPKESPEMQIPQGSSARVKLGSFTIELDDRWHSDDSGGYRFQNGGQQTAQISLDANDWKHYQSLGYEDLDRFVRAVIAATPNVLPLTVRIQGTKDAASCAWQLVGADNVRDIQFLRFWVQNGTLYTLNFTSQYGLYNANRAYFKSIFDSLK